MATRQLMLLIDINEEALLAGTPYTDLPDKLFDIVGKALPNDALELAAMYLANPSLDADPVLKGLALNYHHYAVDIRGEKCVDEKCELHPHKNILNFHDYQQRNNTPPGIN